MYGTNPAQPQLWWTGKSARRKVGILIQELSDDDDDDENDGNGDDNTISGPSSTQGDSAAPWHKDFDGYLYSKDRLGEMTIVEWWGVRIIFTSLSLLSAYYYSITVIIFVVERFSVWSLGIPCVWYTSCYGFISFQRACILICRNHHQ